jgi:hypothetical protein
VSKDKHDYFVPIPNIRDGNIVAIETLFSSLFSFYHNFFLTSCFLILSPSPFFLLPTLCALRYALCSSMQPCSHASMQTYHYKPATINRIQSCNFFLDSWFLSLVSYFYVIFPHFMLLQFHPMIILNRYIGMSD